jgi:hypothetical protein
LPIRSAVNCLCRLLIGGAPLPIRSLGRLSSYNLTPHSHVRFCTRWRCLCSPPCSFVRAAVRSGASLACRAGVGRRAWAVFPCRGPDALQRRLDAELVGVRVGVSLAMSLAGKNPHSFNGLFARTRMRLSVCGAVCAAPQCVRRSVCGASGHSFCSLSSKGPRHVRRAAGPAAATRAL